MHPKLGWQQSDRHPKIVQKHGNTMVQRQLHVLLAILVDPLVCWVVDDDFLQETGTCNISKYEYE